MSEAVTNPFPGTVPSHVPPHLVREFSLFTDPGMLPAAGGCPFKKIADLRSGPPIFYTPQLDDFMRRGMWVLTRAEDIRKVLQDSETFSSKGGVGFSQLLGETWDLIPLEIDPPDHGKYRALLDPELTAKKVEQMLPAVRQGAKDLIAKVRDRKGCDFVDSFAQPFPVMIFLTLFGLPISELDRFLGWAWNLIHNPDIAERARAAAEMRDCLVLAMAEREREPKDDLLSAIVHGKIDDRPLNADERIGYAFLLFIGGLDTVANSLGFMFRHLAENPAEQQRLRDNPALIPSAVEELLRVFSVVTVMRQAKKDTELGGVRIKAGDWLQITLAFGNLDPEATSDAADVKLDRAPNPHFSFSTGRHRCMGSNLARRELAIALEEWIRNMPPFRMADGAKALAHGGGVFGVKRLDIVWG